ncbi:hypothetical protein EDB84DRAFT_1410133 [Lactarius hengduanensis]|nr:hypothetical protein EDB84DRAFT_1410133 [Lactarius hengduanensis]
MSRKSRRRNNSRGPDLEAQSQDEEARQRGVHETRTSGRNGKALRIGGSITPTVQADHGDQAGSSTRSRARAQKDRPSNSGDNHQPGNRRTPGDTTQSMPPRMIGDFDDNANAFWSLHMNEAKSHDEARIQSLKDDMGSVLIFAGLFSVSLISFIIDKIHDLQVDPAKQMVYYQQQNISTQVSSIAPQVSIPSTPPPPYPDFSPTSSDVRVNAFWFMSLVFSISAAPPRNTRSNNGYGTTCMCFQRYSNPLKSARLRQYLYEGAEGWYMPLVAESVPGLIHVSLFLFFVGLCDSLFALNTTIGITTIVPIAICGLLYVLSMIAPIMDPQSPFQTPFHRHDLVSEAEGVSTILLGSDIWWSSQESEPGHVHGEGATGDGRDRRTQRSRRSGNPMADR